VFALTVEDGSTVANLMENNDPSDPTWCPHRIEIISKSLSLKDAGPRFRFGVPSPEFLDFSGPGGGVVRRAMETAMRESVDRMRKIGGELVGDFDFSCFAQTAALLYGSAFVAERHAGIREFLERGLDKSELQSSDNFVYKDERLMRITRAIIGGSQRFSAADAYEGLQRLAALRAASRAQLQKVDFLIVPTAAYNYTVDEIKGEEDDIPGLDEGQPSLPTKNANLGRFTNFANLLDLCGVSVPSGLMKLDFSGDDSIAEARSTHLTATGKSSAVLPFGITIIGPAWTDSYVADIAEEYEKAGMLGPGPLGHGVTPYDQHGLRSV
jgi:allophanate hydrolase